MKKKPGPSIPYVAWRNGRPRFNPSKTLRADGWTGIDLKDEAGNWMDEAGARLWSTQFARELMDKKATAKKKKPGRPRSPTGMPVARSAVSVGELLEDWMNPGQNPAIADLRPNTSRYYRQRAKAIHDQAPDIWNASAEALDKPVCLGLYDKLRRDIGLHSANGSLRVLGIGLQWGMDRGRLPSMLVNPAHKLKTKTPAPRVRFATRAEIDHLVATADTMGRPEMGDMVTLAVWSGQRQADRLAFTISGRDGGRLRLRQEKSRALVSMPEAPELKKRLEAAQERRKQAQVINPLIILDERRWEPFKKDYYRHLFDDIRRAAARTMPSLKTLRDQDLRDTAVTWLGMAGCSVPEICAITGHSFATAHTVLKHYLAINDELADSAMAKMVAWHEGKN